MAIVRKQGAELQALIERSDAARQVLVAKRVELSQKLDVVSRAKSNLTSNPAKLVGGSLVAGFVLKKVFFRKPKSRDSRKNEKIRHLKKERGLLVGLFALLAALAKPAAKMYAGKLLKNYLMNRFDAGATRHPHGRTGYRTGYF